MIVIGGLCIGAILGAYTAKKRGGAAGDIAQYAAVYAIALGIVGLIATVILERLLT